MVTVFSYLLIFTGSVGRGILIVVPVDTLYRTSVISSSIVLLLNPFANLSLAPLFLFSIYGPDLGVWPDCWVSAEFLRAPIPRKGSGSTTTTTNGRYFDQSKHSKKHYTLQKLLIENLKSRFPAYSMNIYHSLICLNFNESSHQDFLIWLLERPTLASRVPLFLLRHFSTNECEISDFCS